MPTSIITIASNAPKIYANVIVVLKLSIDYLFLLCTNAKLIDQNDKDKINPPVTIYRFAVLPTKGPKNMVAKKTCPISWVMLVNVFVCIIGITLSMHTIIIDFKNENQYVRDKRFVFAFIFINNRLRFVTS